MIYLTSKQKALYYNIKLYIETYKYSPSIRELCEMCCVSSPATIHSHLKDLKQLGCIEYKKGQPRTITLVKGIRIGDKNGSNT